MNVPRILLSVLIAMGPACAVVLGQGSTEAGPDNLFHDLLKRKEALFNQALHEEKCPFDTHSPHWLLAQNFERYAKDSSDDSLRCEALREAAITYFAGLLAVDNGLSDSLAVRETWSRFERLTRELAEASASGWDSPDVALLLAGPGWILISPFLESANWECCSEPYWMLFRHSSRPSARAMAGAVLATLRRHANWQETVELAGQVHEIEKTAQVSTKEEVAELALAMHLLVKFLLADLVGWGERLNLGIENYYADHGRNPSRELLLQPALWDSLHPYLARPPSGELSDSADIDSIDLLSNRLATVPGIRAVEVVTEPGRCPRLIHRYVFWEGVEFSGIEPPRGPWQDRTSERLKELDLKPRGRQRRMEHGN